MRWIYALTIIAALVATASADLIPILSESGCNGDVLYHVDYSLGECQHVYICNDGCSFDTVACDGLTSDGLYECTGQCAQVTGESWIIDETLMYRVFTNPTCNGDGFFAIDVSNTPCFTLPGVACQGKSADVSSITAYYYNDSYYDDDDSHARSASTAAVADCLF